MSPPNRFGWLIVTLCVWLGLGIGAIGVMPSLVPATLLMGLSGIGTGVINTYGVSWLQRRTDPAMQGRVMSIVMLASMGLTPLSYAVSGAIAEVDPTLLFLIAGGMMLACGAGTEDRGEQRLPPCRQRSCHLLPAVGESAEEILLLALRHHCLSSLVLRGHLTAV